MRVPRTEILIRASDGSELLRAELTPGEYVLGSGGDCHVCIDAEEVAPRHAQLTINFDHALIEDLGSPAGTLVNGKPISDSVRLWPGQRIQVGSAIIELRRQQMTAQEDASLAPQAAITRTLLPPELLRERRYEVGGVVARGGMGAILSATEAAIERAVAMKVMLENSSADDLVRFIAEAKVTGQLEHPNIVPVHELGVDENDQVFYTMKFVRGITLKKVLELMAAGTEATVAKYPLGTLLTIFQKVCDAMAFAHSKGVIHRDLKPENIMLGDYGEVLVMDWGLAKILANDECRMTNERKGAPAASFDIRHSSFHGTLAGSVMGTPQYMAPEQARGEVDSLDERADIYALGAILYHLLALRPSVSGDDAWAIVERVARGEIDPLRSGDIPVAAEPSRAGGAPYSGQVAGSARERQRRRQECRRSIPDSLAAVVRKAMTFDRSQRYASVADLQADLTAYQNGFATSAEHAGAIRQLHLLMMRHKALAFSIAAIVAVTAGFMGKVIHSERAATAAKILAQRSEAAAKTAESAAKNAEAVALEKSEAARVALARSQTSLAEAAYREFDSRAMLAALDGVPEDLRDADWRYLRARADNSQTAFTFGDRPCIGVAAHPMQPGVFACAPAGGTIVFVDALSGQRVSEFALSERQRKNSYSRSLDFSPDGARLLVGRLGAGGVAIYDASAGKPLAEWDATDVDLVRFSLDGAKTLEIGANGELIVHDAASGRVLWRSSGVRRALFTPGGQVLATSARSARLHDAATGAVVKNLPDTREDGGHLALSPDGATLFIGGVDGVVRGMSLADGAIVFEHRLIDGRRPVRAAISGDGRRMLAAADLSGGQRVARVLDIVTASVTQTLLGGTGQIEGIALHPLTDEAIISGPDTRTWATTTREAESKVVAGSSAAVFWGAEDVFAALSKPLRFGADGRWSDLPFTLPRSATARMSRMPPASSPRLASMSPPAPRSRSTARAATLSRCCTPCARRRRSPASASAPTASASPR